MHWRHPAAIFEVKRWRNNRNAHRLANEQPPFDLNAGVPYWNDVMCIRSINTSWNWMVWVQIQTQEHVTILSRTNNNMFLLQFLCKSKWININMWGLWRHHARSLAAMRRLPLSPAVPPWCCSEKHYLFLHAVPWHTQYTACTNTRRTYTHSTCLV